MEGFCIQRFDRSDHRQGLNGFALRLFVELFRVDFLHNYDVKEISENYDPQRKNGNQIQRESPTNYESRYRPRNDHPNEVEE